MIQQERIKPLSRAASRRRDYVLCLMQASQRAVEAYLEELIVRRELSLNFIFYNGRYDGFEGLPDWAKTTLKEHRKDKREAVYSLASGLRRKFDAAA